MKRTQYLVRLAKLFANKYAGVDAQSIVGEVQQSLTTAIANASSHRESGIMPFMSMLSQDGASLTLSVTRNGNEVLVSPPNVNPGSAAPRYSALPQQIEAYLKRYLDVFPTVRNGEPVQYSDLAMTLTFAPPADPRVAGN